MLDQQFAYIVGEYGSQRPVAESWGLEYMLQILVYALLSSAEITLVAVSFSLIYSLTQFFHFAHAALFTFGAYFCLLFKVYLGLPMWLAVLLAVGCSAVLGCLMDVAVYRRLRRRKASPMILLLASLGMYIVLQNVVSMVFGDDTKSIRSGEVREGLNVFGARITPIQIGIILTSVVLVVAVAVLLKKTKFGKAIRAVANDPELAGLSGIESRRVILWTFALGSALAGIAGILVALDVDMTPTMGMNALMMGVVAVVIGGVGSVSGVAMGALLLGLAQHLGVLKISSQWQDAIAFVILFLFLMIRPEGFLGKKVKKAKI